MSADVDTPTAPAETRRSYLRPNADALDEATREKVETGILNAGSAPLDDPAPESAEAQPEAPSVPSNFSGVGQDVERRSRETASMVRMLEQHRRQLAKAERDHAQAAEMLSRIMPVIDETNRSLKVGLEQFKPGDETGHLQTLFTLNARAFEELEKVSEDLNASAAWHRSCWEQYVSSVERAQEMRST